MAKEKPIGNPVSPRDIDDGKQLKIRRGRVESVDLYEIKDSELDILENGSPSNLQLNFAIFLLSLAFSAICSLATATFNNDSVKTTYIVISVVGVLLGVYLMICWWRNHTSLATLCKRIRERITPEIGEESQDMDQEQSPNKDEPIAPKG